MREEEAMHEPVKAYVEEYLAGSDSLPREFTAHIAECEECRRNVAELQEQSQLLRVLRLAEDAEVEPGVGFYARVVERIDSQRQSSIWSIFLEPAFGRRLAVASAVLAVMMGVYLVSSEPSGMAPMASNSQAVMLAGEDEPGPVLGAGQDQDRGSVLVNLVTYQEQ